WWTDGHKTASNKGAKKDKPSTSPTANTRNSTKNSNDRRLEGGFRGVAATVGEEGEESFSVKDLLTGDRSLNLYTIALNEVASNSLACHLARACSLQSWLWLQRFSHLNFATINKLVKNNLVQGLPKMKFEKDHLCSACEQGKIHRKHHKSKTVFASNKPLYLLHMDLCGLMRVESINGKRYVLVVVDDYSRYTWVFFLHSKDEASDVINSFIKNTQVNLQLQVQRVRTDNCTEFKKTLAKFFDVVEESSSSSLNDDVQQSLDEVNVSSSNTQSVSNKMIHNVDEASTSHNVFNECLEDAYFDASDLKLSVRTRGQLANLCLFSCFLSCIEPTNVAEALKDADWVSAMQDKLDQFARLKYILDILKRFGMENCDTVPTPMVEQAKLKLDLVGKPVDHTDYRSMIGSLMYVTSSRPDIMFATYTDHARCHLDRKSTSASVQFLDDKLVCWSSKKQNCVSISTAESEYVAVSGCCAQVLWMRTQLMDYGFFCDKVPIYCDSNSAIAISCNPV
nr:retrovirus-related Pol polyprotein from transposon TNT 1-94 [Tanacetum cinerariifolium]